MCQRGAYVADLFQHCTLRGATVDLACSSRGPHPAATTGSDVDAIHEHPWDLLQDEPATLPAKATEEPERHGAKFTLRCRVFREHCFYVRATAEAHCATSADTEGRYITHDVDILLTTARSLCLSFLALVCCVSLCKTGINNIPTTANMTAVLAVDVEYVPEHFDNLLLALEMLQNTPLVRVAVGSR